jgi:hypothetical protein
MYLLDMLNIKLVSVLRFLYDNIVKNTNTKYKKLQNIPKVTHYMLTMTNERRGVY